ncbi:MAG: hypothetical protein NVS3B17_02000 [Vulcanimicrobiaceae bacterium]
MEMISPFRLAFGPIARAYLPVVAWGAFAALVGCAPSTALERGADVGPTDIVVRLDALTERVASWRIPLASADLRGLRLLYDTPVPGGPTLAVVRSAVRANHRLDPFDALVFVTHARGMARRHRLDGGFFCATLLQESGFNPDAISAAGAVGIAQFTLETADRAGVDPFDWADAMRGSAALLGGYVSAYDGVYPDPYAAALAAYNAGPGAVARYRGIPPYPETRDYILDIFDRWSRIDRDATGLRKRRHQTKPR